MKGPNAYSPGDSCEVWYRNEWRPCRVLGPFGWLGHQRVHIYDIGFYSWVSEDNLRHQTDPIADTILRERDLLIITQDPLLVVAGHSPVIFRALCSYEEPELGIARAGGNWQQAFAQMKDKVQLRNDLVRKISGIMHNQSEKPT